MADNKRQHYVPQFYLRNFSHDGTNIFGFNIAQKTFFSGPITTVCAEAYFYGKEKKDTEIERSLGPLEGKAASIIRSINSYLTFPNNTEDWFLLLVFMMDLRGRTAAKRDSAKRQTKLMSDIVTSGLDIKDFKIVWNADHAYAMLVHMTSVPLISDLAVVLLVNKTNAPFIISDHPVIFHNTRFNHIKQLGVKGFQSRGLQIFWPISPTLCILLYDPQYYRIKKASEQTCIVDSEEDIFSINTLQYLYCREIVLFPAKTHEDLIKIMDSRFESVRNKTPEVQKTYPHPTKPNAEMIHFYKEPIDFDLKLSFITILDGAEYGVRNEGFIQEHHKFMEKIMKDAELRANAKI